MPHGRRISVIGLGYVGLPIAVEFGKLAPVVGFDCNPKRIEALNQGNDWSNQVSPDDLRKADIEFTVDPAKLKGADFHVVTVPTPVDEAKVPDFGPLLSATRTLAAQIKKGDIIVYESTVYPGATEERCVPLLEDLSSLKGGVDFHVGYSPERINPGDAEHTFANITKVVAAQDRESLEVLSRVYSSVVRAGVHQASSIRVAEAAKVIENIQRDVNIALINELAMIFHQMGIDTTDVLAASRTKWNFLPFSPGLVGGHCIGVDPYYMTYKAAMIGYNPQIILAGRRINDGMGRFIAQEVIKELIQMDRPVKGARITFLGLTFKENVPDIRNSRVVDLIEEFKNYGANVQIHDPLASPEEVRAEYGFEISALEELEPADAVIFAVPHDTYPVSDWGFFAKLLTKKRGIVADVRSRLPSGTVPPGIRHWRL